MNDFSETSPFTYKKSNNYFAKKFRQINETLELTEDEVNILIIFATLRIIDLILIFIFFDKENAYHYIKLVDYFILLISFLISYSVYLNKNNVKQRAVMLSIFFNFSFVCFDITSLIFFFMFKAGNLILLCSLLINIIWLVKTVFLIFKMTMKFLKVLKNRTNTNNNRAYNSSILRKAK